MKSIKMSYDARDSIKNGIDKLADLVKATIGPKGRNVIISKNYGKPIITNDGVTIAKQVQLEDEFQDLGARICRQVAQKTNDQAGDGTTTATILAQAIVQHGNNSVKQGVNSVFLQRQLEKTGQKVVDYIKTLSREISNKDEIEQIATISANNDTEIGKIISMAIEESGIQGVINIEESRSMETWLERVEGMEITNGYVSPYFITDPVKMQVVLQDAYVLVFNSKIYAVSEIVQILKKVSMANSSLLIFAEDVEGQALATLVVNKVKGVINACAVKIPGMGDNKKQMAMDICAVTGAEYLSKEIVTKLQEVTLAQLGFAKKVIISNDSTVIREGSGRPEVIENRVESIKFKMDKASTPMQRERFQKRIAKIIDGVSVIHIGAQTQMQLKEKKYRLQDALNATRAAIQQGIVPGAGTTLVKAVKYLSTIVGRTPEEELALLILTKALVSPLYQIAINSGQQSDSANTIVMTVMQDERLEYGFNAITGQLQDLNSAGIIDPVKVVRCALQNAISIAGLFLTTEGIILEHRTQESRAQGDMFNQMGGM